MKVLQNDRKGNAMIFPDYQSFVMFSWLITAPVMLGMSLVLILNDLIENVHDRPWALRGVVLAVAKVVALFAQIELVVGIVRTYRVAMGNAYVLPGLNEGLFPWLIFATVYLGPLVYAVFVAYMGNRALDRRAEFIE